MTESEFDVHLAKWREMWPHGFPNPKALLICDVLLKYPNPIVAKASDWLILNHKGHAPTGQEIESAVIQHLGAAQIREETGCGRCMGGFVSAIRPSDGYAFSTPCTCSLGQKWREKLNFPQPSQKPRLVQKEWKEKRSGEKDWEA